MTRPSRKRAAAIPLYVGSETDQVPVNRLLIVVRRERRL